MFMNYKKLSFLSSYRAVYSGSRKPAIIIAHSWHDAVSKAMALCMDDESETELLSITWIDVVVF